MLTANTQDVAQRVREGFLAVLMQGPTADEAITLGARGGGTLAARAGYAKPCGAYAFAGDIGTCRSQCGK
jgi:hypothetical protein